MQSWVWSLAWQQTGGHLCRIVVGGREVAHEIRHPGDHRIGVQSLVQAQPGLELDSPASRLPGSCPVVERGADTANGVERQAGEFRVVEVRGDLQCALRI